MPSSAADPQAPSTADVPAAAPDAPPAPPSAPDAGASIESSAGSSDALEVTNVPESLYVASSPKAEAAAASLELPPLVSRFAPFEESYADMKELRRALKVLSVQRNAPYYMQHSSPQRVEARCPSWRQRKRRASADNAAEVGATPACEFVVSANRHADGRVYITRAVVTHTPTCKVFLARLAANAEVDGTGETGDKSRTSSGITASALLETALPFMGELATSRGGQDAVKPKDVSDIMKEKFGVQPSYMTTWRALSAFRQQRKQEDSASYMKLDGYLQAFAETNVGSLVAFEHQHSSQVPAAAGKPNSKIFGRAFLCPKPLHDALRYCRGSMLLSVFLVTSAFGGVVFTATAQDAMGDNVPIAIGLASAETENDWSFFLKQLRRAFPDLERSVTSLVHNRGDELTRAVHSVFPNCPQSNEVEMFIRNAIQAAAATAAAASNATSGSPATPAAIGATSTLPLDASMQWVEALCTKSPLMILVGWVSQVARTLFQRYERYGHLSSEYPAEFHSLAAEYEGEASRFDVVRTSESEFEVIDQQTSAGRVVNFAKQTCTCGEYDVSRFPCLHVFLAVSHAGMLQTDVIPRIFLMTSLKALYAGRITPIDIDTVPSDGVTIPQSLPKSRGRPRKVQQIQQFGDPRQEKLSCSVCGVKGHNKRTCKRLSTVPIPIARGTSEVHPDDVANGQEDTTFLVSTYGDALAFDNSLGGTEGHVSDGQSLHLTSGKRRRLETDDPEEKKANDDYEEAGTNGVALVIGVAFALAPALAAVCFGDNLEKYGVFTPKKIALGATPSMDGQSYAGGFTLTTDEPLATLDYDYEVAGLPYFVVSSVSNGPVEVEVKYSEQFPSLSTNFSDGPSQFTTSIANSRRVETHRFTETDVGATITSMLSQPGERWQTLRLLTGDSVTFETVGLQASVEVIDDLTTLAGKYSSSNAKYDEIWKLGARAVTAACLDAGSQVPSWSSSEENGTFVPGTRPGISYKTWNLTDYVLTFESQIIRGGAGYTIAYDLTGNRDGVQIHLASEYPNDTTYSNTNTTLFPANTATLAFGYDFANATSMTSYILGQYNVPFSVKENVWYPVEIRVNSTAGNIVFSVDGQQVFAIVLTEMGFTDSQLFFYGWSSRGEGAIGFGGWQDQASFVRNVSVTSLTDSSEVLYSNPMTDESVVVPEFGGQTNAYGACLDGAKRDRYIWLGDFYHTTRVMGVANSKPEQIAGTWEFLFEFQDSYGQFPGYVPISYASPMPTPEVFLYDAGKSDAYYNFPDYVILGLIGLESYMDYYDDIPFVEAHWEEFTRAMTWLVGNQASNGLIDLAKYEVVFLGSGAGMAVNAAAVQCLDGMARVARAIGDWESANAWIETAASVKTAINELLWNDTLGNYAVDVSTPEVYGVSAIAFALTSGVANDTQVKLCVESLEGLRQGPGYLDASDTDDTTKISPNTNGFLLDALLQHGYTEQAVFLLDNLWDAMISNESYRSGAPWEYVSQSLTPGLEEFTSLSHPWGGAPTYALTNYVAGIRPVEFGFRRWTVNPLVTGLNTTSASATVNTPFGSLSAAWELVDNQLSVTITAPVGTDGIFEVAQPSSPEGIYEQHVVGTGEATSFVVQL